MTSLCHFKGYFLPYLLNSELESPHHVTVRMIYDALPLSELCELAGTRLTEITALCHNTVSLPVRHILRLRYLSAPAGCTNE